MSKWLGCPTVSCINDLCDKGCIRLDSECWGNDVHNAFLRAKTQDEIGRTFDGAEWKVY